MARLFIDGFESGDFGLWDILSANQIYSPVTGMTGNYAGIVNVSSGYIEKILPSNKTELYISFKINYTLNSNGFLPAFKDSASAVIASLTRNTTSTFLEFRLGTDAAAIQATGTIPIALATTYLIEIRYKPLNSGGILTTKINGAQDINFSGDSTAGLENISSVRFGRTSGSVNAYIIIDDVVFDDANWIGNTKIQAIVPTGAGSTNGQTSLLQQVPHTLDSNSYSLTGPFASIRQVITSAQFTDNRTSIRLKLAGCSDQVSNIVGCSIGERSGTTDDFAVVPTRITFNGGENSITIPAGISVFSDFISFSLDKTKDYLVHFYLSGSTIYYRRASLDLTTYYILQSAGSDETLVQSVSGYTETANRWTFILGIESSLSASSENYKAVDEIPYSDNDYIKTSSSQIDTYAMGNLSGSIASIKSVAVQSRNWREGNGAYDRAQHIVRPASTDRLSASKTAIFPITAISFQSIWELNPEDSAAWEEADVNGMEAGIKAVTA
jgi:hypothetical protein